jgi:predicted acyl esterase
MLYELPDSTVRSVDKAEAVETGLYQAFDVEVELEDGVRISAVTYRLKDDESLPGLPNRAYVFQMRQAYKEWGLDEAALDKALENGKR